MAGCERGYLCTVCGQDVEEITDSVLYLRYVLGEVEWDNLNRAPETHIRCEPTVAQFIVDSSFEPVTSGGAFSKVNLDPEFVRSEEERVTRAYRRLREVASANVPIAEYPLARAIAQPAAEANLASVSRRLLFLDDDPARAAEFLTENPDAIWVQTVPECLSQLNDRWDEVHLDHDLGGQTFVDSNQVDCGMEVIRWLCSEPRDHLRETKFLVHTHNSLAGLLMVLQMRSRGYKAEFCPFGVDPARLLSDEDDGFPDDYQRPPIPARQQVAPGVPRPPGIVRRLFDTLKAGWSSIKLLNHGFR